MGQEQLQEMLGKLGSIGVILPAVALLAGLGLWLLGRKLARPACAFSGLVLGGIGGLIASEALSDQGGLVLPMVIGAAIAGALLAALLFRLWMAVSGALIFALVASSGMLLWQGPPQRLVQPEAPNAASTETGNAEAAGEITLTIPNEVISEAIRDLATSAIDGAIDGVDESASTEFTLDSETAKQAGSSLVQALRGLGEYYWGQVQHWWSIAGTGQRGGVGLAGLIAAVLGLLLGLVWPYEAASAQSALVGSVLMLFSAFSLLAQLMPGHLDWLPATPRGVLICVGLITAAGFVLQWTFFARKADK